MQKHMSRAHGTTISNPLFAGFVRRANLARKDSTGTNPDRKNASLPQRKTTFCPVCKVVVRVSRLKNHLANVHERRFSPSHPTQTPSAKDPTRKTTALTAPREKNLDATKLYAHPCREQGRYGSHPSHDSFDDESGPN